LPPASGDFLVDSLFHAEDGGHTFLPKHVSLSTLYGVTTHKTVALFIVIVIVVIVIIYSHSVDPNLVTKNMDMEIV
jgi:hypothetical protein